MKELADIALNTAKMKGATYADIRINRYYNQFINTREKRVTNIVNTESYGFGVRVIVDGVWGFAASHNVTKEEIARITEAAIAIARANKTIQRTRVELVPVKAYTDTWKTPIKKDPWDVSLSTKVDLLLKINEEAGKAKGPGPLFVDSSMFFRKESKYFASTDGSYLDQLIVASWPNFTVTSVDEKGGKFEQRSCLAAPTGKGYEYIEEYPLLAEAPLAAEEAIKKHTAKAVEPGKKDIVLDPTNMWLTIHESIGHATELDRILGYEANYAGTSFVTVDGIGKLQYGSQFVNIVADKTQTDGLATVGYDDDGVKTRQWDLIRDGKLVDLQAIRDQATIIGHKESHGCCYADNWSSVPFQRMPNVSLQPATGDKSISAEDLMADVKDGVYVVGDSSYSIDQQRYNFQFSGQTFWEIKNGKKGQMLRDVAYQSRTPDFWNSCDGVGSRQHYKLGGSFFDGKGQPGQVNAVSHGCPPARFRKVNILNTGGKLG